MLLYNVCLFLFYWLFGVCIGSFLNVLIYRLPIKMSAARGRSICPQCGHTLGTLDLIPLFSFLFLGGKCRYCKAKISLRYPAVEMLTGCVFGICGLVFPLSLYSIIACLFCSALTVAAFIDHDTGEIPDGVSVVIFALAILSIPILGYSHAINGLIGAVVMLVIMLPLYYLLHTPQNERVIGGGDVKLCIVCGLLLGWKLILFGFGLSYILAALFCIVPLIRRRLNAKSEIRMAPFFAVGFAAAMLFGERLINMWISLWS